MAQEVIRPEVIRPGPARALTVLAGVVVVFFIATALGKLMPAYLATISTMATNLAICNAPRNKKSRPRLSTRAAVPQSAGRSV